MTERTRPSSTRASTAFRLATLTATALLLTSCAYWPSAGQNGLLYTNLTRPVAVLDQEVPKVRTGEACSTGILGLYAAGNSTIKKAKTNVGITKVSHIEERFTHVFFGAYSQYCTIVSGQ